MFKTGNRLSLFFGWAYCTALINLETKSFKLHIEEGGTGIKQQRKDSGPFKLHIEGVLGGGDSGSSGPSLFQLVGLRAAAGAQTRQ